MPTNDAILLKTSFLAGETKKISKPYFFGRPKQPISKTKRTNFNIVFSNKAAMRSTQARRIYTA
jgi:hypothetical protein